MNFLGSIGKDPDFGQIVTSVLGALLGGIFGGGMSGGSFDCDMNQKIYEAGMIQGINGNVNMMSAEQMIQTALNGGLNGNDRFSQAIAAASTIIMNLNNSMGALPSPQAPTGINGARGLPAVMQVLGFTN